MGGLAFLTGEDGGLGVLPGDGGGPPGEGLTLGVEEPGLIKPRVRGWGLAFLTGDEAPA